MLLILCLAAAQAAFAEVSLNLDSSSETGGVWTYNYSMDNSSGSGYVYNVFLNTIDPVTVASPSGWSGSYASGGVTWHTDSWVAPGLSAVSGFTITSPYAPGTLIWAIDVASGTVPSFDGSVSGPSKGAGTPEPASLCLLGLAVGPALAWGRRRRGRLGSKKTMQQG